MKVPFRLRRSTQAHAALAAVVEPRSARVVLDLCERLGVDPAGRVFEVAEGYLLRLDAPTRSPMPGALRLRALAVDLFLPVDAELSPTLLDDEAEGLARRGGLVFLPDGRVLGFDPSAPLPLSALLTAPRRPPRRWEALPSRPPLADRIDEILLERPDETPDTVLDGDDDQPIGAEPPRPDESTPAAAAAGRAAMGLGRMFSWVGKALGSGRISALGAEWVDRAMRLAPRLSEEILGRQSAALRDLLRDFREGNIDRALRRAVPLGDASDPPPSGPPETGDHLPGYDPSYRLADLLTPPGRGGGGVWQVKRDVLAELREEYRKAADEAARRGDFRRAAAIYGKLLRDYRAAANALLRGGLHHDAAVVLLARLDDPAGAARAFEAAGEFDRAVQLYRQVKLHEAAGDLLRRLGEEDAAVAEYFLAADRLARQEGGDLPAGDLLLAKAGRPELALERFAAGWARRPAPNSVACSLRILTLRAQRGEADAVRTLIDEADEHFASGGDAPTVSRFYNGVAAGALLPPLAAHRDEFLDRALMGLAAELRKQALPGARVSGLVSTLLSPNPSWAPALASDAAFAVSAASARPADPTPDAEPSMPGLRRFRVGQGRVLAVAGAPTTGEVVIGFDDGQLYVFRPEGSEVVRVGEYIAPIVAVSTDPECSRIVVLRAHSTGHGTLSTFARKPDGSFEGIVGVTLDELGEPRLSPVVAGDDQAIVGLARGGRLELFMTDSLTHLEVRGTDEAERNPAAVLLTDQYEYVLRCLIQSADGDWGSPDPVGRGFHRVGLRWSPGPPADSSLHSQPLSVHGSFLGLFELAAVDRNGSIHWARFEEGHMVAHNTAARSPRFLAVAIVRPGLVAAVSQSQIYWFRGGHAAFHMWRKITVGVPSAVAAFASPSTGELIVVCRDGFVARIPLP